MSLRWFCIYTMVRNIQAQRTSQIENKKLGCQFKKWSISPVKNCGVVPGTN